MGSSQRKRRLGEGLITEIEVVSHDCDTYLQKLHTPLIAYALAGVAPLPGVGDPTKEFVLGANSTEFVEAPLDVLLQYYFPARKSLAWLQHRDSEERAEWVPDTGSTRSLGSVVKERMETRDVYWVPAATAEAPQPQAVPSSWRAKSFRVSPRHSA